MTRFFSNFTPLLLDDNNFIKAITKKASVPYLQDRGKKSIVKCIFHTIIHKTTTEC